MEYYDTDSWSTISSSPKIERFRHVDYPRQASRGKGEECGHMKDFLRDVRRVTLLFDSMGKHA